MQFSSLIRDIIHFPALLFARTFVYWKAYSRIRKVRKLRITPHALHLALFRRAYLALPRLLSHLPSKVSFYPMLQFILLLLTVWLCLYPRIDNERKYNKCKQDCEYIPGVGVKYAEKNQWRGVVCATLGKNIMLLIKFYSWSFSFWATRYFVSYINNSVVFVKIIFTLYCLLSNLIVRKCSTE